MLTEGTKKKKKRPEWPDHSDIAKGARDQSESIRKMVAGEGKSVISGMRTKAFIKESVITNKCGVIKTVERHIPKNVGKIPSVLQKNSSLGGPLFVKHLFSFGRVVNRQQNLLKTLEKGYLRRVVSVLGHGMMDSPVILWPRSSFNPTIRLGINGETIEPAAIIRHTENGTNLVHSIFLHFLNHLGGQSVGIQRHKRKGGRRR